MKPEKYQTNLLFAFGVLLIISLLYNYHHYAKNGYHALLIRHSVAQTAQNYPFPTNRNLALPILMYHHIGTAPTNGNATQLGLTVSTTTLEQEVSWLKEQGYNSISLNDIYLYSLGKFQMPKKPVVFTFDDGYDDAFQNAIPILKTYGFTGSFGIITQWPGTVVGDNTYATWDEIKTAADAGNEIVCHTQNHFDGTNSKFDAKYIFDNLSGCQKDLANHLRSTEPILIYPYGHYNSVYLEQAGEAGFKMGLTVHKGKLINLDNLMEVPRIRVHANEDFEIFKKLISE